MLRKVLVRLPLVLALWCVIGLSPSPASAGGLPKPAVVIPTGSFPADVERVQRALDRGGVVLLKSRNASGRPTPFDFGPASDASGTAEIRKDVIILGERDRSAQATIRGGSPPLRGIGKVQMSLVDVRFEAPGGSALLLHASAGALIVGNEITGVVPMANEFGVPIARGIGVIGSGDARAFSGRIVVSTNWIHDLHEGLASALSLERVGSDVTIHANRIDSIATTAIEIYQPGGDVNVLANVITPGAGSGGDFEAGNGIQIYGADGRHRIEGNQITCANPLADGIILTGGWNWLDWEPGPAVVGAIIRRNEISMISTSDSCCGAITFFDSVSSAVVSQNTLRGTAAYGIMLAPTGLVDPTEATNSVFSKNDLSQFAASDPEGANVVLFSHAHDNRFRGSVGSVIDLGENNVFTD